MPRSARLEELGLSMHVIVQGIDRCPLFSDDYDRTCFVLVAARVFRDMGVDVIAWAMLGNHVHLILRPTHGTISKAMQRVLGTYAQRFNRRHGRVGPLYRGRYWSRPVEDEDDLIGLIAYVLLNPLRAGIVQTVEELALYPWTSFAELLSPPSRRPALVNAAHALCAFAGNAREASVRLFQMLAGRAAEDAGVDEQAAHAPLGLGALRPREQLDLQLERTHLLRLRSARIDGVLRDRESVTSRRMRLRNLAWTLDRAISRACRLAGASEERLRAGGRRRPESRARGLVACFAGTYLGCSDTEIARTTGVARQGIARSRARGIALAEELAIGWETFFELPAPGEEAS